METLFATSRELISRVSTAFVRDKHDEIDWNSRLVAILGSRGTGKTTMILQHIRLYDNTPQTLYVMADDFYFTAHRLVDLARQFMLQGGKHLYIDEIHKYPGWSTEIKNIYDMMPDLKVVYSGSSILDLEKGGADLGCALHQGGAVRKRGGAGGLRYRQDLCRPLRTDHDPAL